MQSLFWNCRSARVISAARRPAPAISKVCGELFSLAALFSLGFGLFGRLENCFRKVGRLAILLSSLKELVSRILLAPCCQCMSVILEMKVTKPTDSALTITITAKRSSAETNANIALYTAQNAVETSGIGQGVGPESTFVRSVESLSAILESVVKFIFGKMDALAEVRDHTDGAVDKI